MELSVVDCRECWSQVSARSEAAAQEQLLPAGDALPCPRTGVLHGNDTITSHLLVPHLSPCQVFTDSISYSVLPSSSPPLFRTGPGGGLQMVEKAPVRNGRLGYFQVVLEDLSHQQFTLTDISSKWFAMTSRPRHRWLSPWDLSLFRVSWLGTPGGVRCEYY